MAVGGGTHDRLGADVARSARPVLNDEWLAEALGQPLTDQAREDVGRAAGRKADDDANRPRRIGVCPSEARDSRQRRSASGQMQKLSAGKLHGVYPPGRRTVNTEPLPGSLVTVTSPPIMRASLREMARPSPVPP